MSQVILTSFFYCIYFLFYLLGEDQAHFLLLDIDIRFVLYVLYVLFHFLNIEFKNFLSFDKRMLDEA